MTAQLRKELTWRGNFLKSTPPGLKSVFAFRALTKRLATLPGAYGPPRGRLFLAYDDDRLAGCGALRPLDEVCCEMKRLYVRPDFRGLGVGKRMMEAIVSAGREIGYKSMRLDTLPAKMDQALAMYRRYGFKEIEPYYPTPVAGATFMELSL
ncbi:MAG TPA: GNAT family N-acetyltransferase [Pyrinomonadaceae bacterium]|nr:GNAT family N-acetyltransferase [Pyrinomonadaceae bacterium]